MAGVEDQVLRQMEEVYRFRYDTTSSGSLGRFVGSLLSMSTTRLVNITSKSTLPVLGLITSARYPRVPSIKVSVFTDLLCTASLPGPL